jgi:hypothetical protein
MCELCGYVYDDCLCDLEDVRQQQVTKHLDQIDEENRAQLDYQRMLRVAAQQDHFLKTHEQYIND